MTRNEKFYDGKRTICRVISMYQVYLSKQYEALFMGMWESDHVIQVRHIMMTLEFSLNMTCYLD